MSRSAFALKGLLLAVLIFLLSQEAVRAMTSTNFSINWDSVNSGGNDVSTSTNYDLRDTIGEQATGFSSSSNYTVSAGYRVGDQDLQVLSFNIGTQEKSTQTAYTAFDAGGNTVTVSTTTYFSVGDLIGVVENEGLSEYIAVGRVASSTGLVLTVDRWDGVPGSMSAIPVGGDDFVYRVNGSNADLGVLSSSIGSSSFTGTQVTSDAVNGYTVYVNDDGNFRIDPTHFIQNVSDGTVTVGSEEYGGAVFGSQATSTGSDFAFATSTRSIQESTSTTATDERVALIYKASINGGTPAGNYSQIVYYTITPNY